ncbi:MAG: hypothetical protein M3072_09980 [Candidatus Dormibacteraeota bacterium]|nr:hypothetical protein [Candidatus Dormibacteraeota bacterium]
MLIRHGGERWHAPASESFSDEATLELLLKESPDLLPGTQGAPLAVVSQLEGGHFYWGTGKYPSVGAWYLVEGRAVAVWSIYTDPGRTVFAINFEWMARNEISENRLADLVTAMRSIPGIAPYYAGLEAKAWRKRPSVPTSTLFADSGADEVIIQALDRLVTGT